LAKRPSLLAIFAHPDDETIAAGGTLARYAQAGVRTALLCATRGEWGSISDDALASYQNLGRVRERELRAACAVLGVRWLRFLNLPDGGLSWAVEEENALEKVVRLIRKLRPQVIVTFGPDGLYGHDDHIIIGQLTTEAFGMAGDPQAFPEHLAQGLAPHHPAKLYYAAFRQGLVPTLVERLAQAGQPSNLWGLSPDQFGIPEGEITATIDVHPFLDRKLAALRCHRTQLASDNTFAMLTPELAAEFLGVEHFRRYPNNGNGQIMETDLFAGLNFNR